mmetsp:Transcript_39297/g.45094  ORF Transcript_39297/g.45094 Transcript_39297/m.45094 type:complete len:137 (-) Transcript_39297:218-628(-)
MESKIKNDLQSLTAHIKSLNLNLLPNLPEQASNLGDDPLELHITPSAQNRLPHLRQTLLQKGDNLFLLLRLIEPADNNLPDPPKLLPWPARTKFPICLSSTQCKAKMKSRPKVCPRSSSCVFNSRRKKRRFGWTSS